jgi:hypothetical protein
LWFFDDFLELCWWKLVMDWGLTWDLIWGMLWRILSRKHNRYWRFWIIKLCCKFWIEVLYIYKGYINLSLKTEISERSAKFILVFYLGKKSILTLMESPGKGIQNRKTPNKILLQIFWESVGEFYKAFAYVIFNAKLYHSYVIVQEFCA